MIKKKKTSEQLWKEFLDFHPYLSQLPFGQDDAMGASIMMIWLLEQYINPLIERFSEEFTNHTKTIARVAVLISRVENGKDTKKALAKLKEHFECLNL